MKIRETSLPKLAAASLLLGGVLGIVTHILHPAEPHSAEEIRMYVRHTPAAHVALWFGVLLTLLGLPQLFGRLLRSTSILTLISFPLLFLGLALTDGMHCPLEFGALPAIYQVAPDRIAEIYMHFNQTDYGLLSMIGAPVIMLGLLLFIVGQWRSKALAAWPRWLLLGSLLGMVAALAGVPGSGVCFTVLLYAGLGGYGAWMLADSADAATRLSSEI